MASLRSFLYALRALQHALRSSVIRGAADPAPAFSSARRSLRSCADRAAAVAIDTHSAGSKWNKALLDNAARPSGALVYSGPEGAVLSIYSSIGSSAS